jgi:transaldolase / glucose-6-phosphate isomerase
MLSPTLHTHEKAVDAALADLQASRIVQRIWEHDHTVWRPDPEEITNRLGWLDIAEVMRPLYGSDDVEAVASDIDQSRASSTVGTIKGLVDAVRAAGYTHTLLLGMGGSSLAPEVFSKTFGTAEGYLELAVLDSTDPGAVLAYDRQLDPARTLYIVSTKSGGTVETLSFFKYFYNRTLAVVGAGDAGDHFIAITDPGSKLEALAREYDFRAIFLNDPDIGGRYSALSYFGLVPAALVGVDVPLLLDRAIEQAQVCRSADSPAARLGVILGELARQGRDKATFITSPSIASFGDWVEQLIAESTGKDGTGILPVVGEVPAAPSIYGADRLFIYLHLAGDGQHDVAVAALAAEYPMVRMPLADLYDLGAQFFLWEFAIAVAGQCLDIQPFDQPNVESAKVSARKMAAAYAESGKLPEPDASLTEQGVTVYADVAGNSLAEIVNTFLDQGSAGDYIALQAYVTPNAATDVALAELQSQLRARTHLATTVGCGPRFLHSTGQLHKGDGGNGLFIQFMSDAPEDVAIPDTAGEAESSMSFGVLIRSQALGDREALLESQRRVLTLDLGTDVLAGLAVVR